MAPANISTQDLLRRVLIRLVPESDTLLSNPEPSAASGIFALLTHAGSSITAVPIAAESVSASGKATGPAEGAALATIVAGSLATAGTYRITAEAAYLAGTPVAADDLNIEIREGATSKKKILVPRALNNRGTAEIYLNLDGATAVSANAVAAATADVVYAVSITATLVRS